MKLHAKKPKLVIKAHTPENFEPKLERLLHRYFPEYTTEDSPLYFFIQEPKEFYDGRKEVDDEPRYHYVCTCSYDIHDLRDGDFEFGTRDGLLSGVMQYLKKEVHSHEYRHMHLGYRANHRTYQNGKGQKSVIDVSSYELKKIIAADTAR